MHIKKLFGTIILLLSLAGTQAQVKEYLAAADRYFASGDYFSASQYYEKYLGKGKAKNNQLSYNPYATSASGATVAKKTTVPASNREQIIYNLAESYRQLNFYEKAEPYYIQALNFDKAKFPLLRYHYATTLRALEKYDEAKAQFMAFSEEYKQEDLYSESAAREIKNLDFIKEQMNKKGLKSYTIIKSPKVLNDTGATYAPAWLNNNTLLFTSTKPEKAGSKEYTNRIYQVSYADGVLGSVEKSGVPQPDDIHQGVVTVTPDGNTMFLSRWTVGKEKKVSSIYSSKKTGKGWSDPVLVNSINFQGSNSQQPFVMPDGRHLLFSSDKTSGIGGFDLWLATLDSNGMAENPVNMGNSINTKYDEQAPYYHAPSGTLVFSSNGRVGMGGYDFFYSKGSIDQLPEPVNYGYPVNSVKDDLYFASRGGAGNVLEDVLFSSDRSAACCLEMFSLKKLKSAKQVSGIVVACDKKTPLSGVKVDIVDTVNNKTIAVQTTDAEGNYSFTIDEWLPLKATASNTGYFSNTLVFSGPDDTDADSLNNPEICLTLKPAPDEAIVLENVYYDYDESTLKKESYPALDKLVKLLKDNPDTSIEINGHTDSNGSDEYNMTLSDARAQSVVNYLISKGINKTRLQSKGFGESLPVESNTNPDGTDNPAGREKNRRTEFKVRD